MTVLPVGLGDMPRARCGGKMLWGHLSEDTAVRHLSIWYFGVQEGDLGWRPRVGVICVEGGVETGN